MSKIPDDLGRGIATLVATTREAALATLTGDGAPFASYVTVAPDADGRPLLLLSDLARHTRNLKRNPCASLLFVGRQESGRDPLVRSRVTLVGNVTPAAGQVEARDRFCQAHPYAADYAEFGDFHVYRMEVANGHLVAGFGRIAKLGAGDLFGSDG